MKISTAKGTITKVEEKQSKGGSVYGLITIAYNSKDVNGQQEETYWETAAVFGNTYSQIVEAFESDNKFGDVVCKYSHSYGEADENGKKKRLNDNIVLIKYTPFVSESAPAVKTPVANKKPANKQATPPEFPEY